MKLPTVMAQVTTSHDFFAGTYVQKVIEVEVLTVHFERRTMRVRYLADVWNKKKLRPRTEDISAEPFFEKYGKVFS